MGQPRTSLRKKILFAGIIGGLCLLLLELGVRAIFATQVGPRILLYGIVNDRDEQAVQKHENVVAGRYSKYFPHERRTDTDADTGESFEVTINSAGFRGDDFAVAKPPGVTRIVTLGASSTFGYHDRDGETYPAIMEQMLGDACPARQFEVINLGIPHLDAEQIQALFVEEALPLDPDVVTFYEGINNSEGGSWRAPSAPSISSRLRRAAREHSLLAAFLSDLRKKRSYSAQEAERHIAGKSEQFLASIESIHAEASANQIALAVVTQQAKSSIEPREKMAGLTYAAEIALIRERLARDGAIGPSEVYLLTHETLMSGLHRWAGEQDVLLVDGIAALDRDRDTLVSWVHLNAKGNRILARAIVDGLLPMVCPGER